MSFQQGMMEYGGRFGFGRAGIDCSCCYKKSRKIINNVYVYIKYVKNPCCDFACGKQTTKPLPIPVYIPKPKPIYIPKPIPKPTSKPYMVQTPCKKCLKKSRISSYYRNRT